MIMLSYELRSKMDIFPAIDRKPKDHILKVVGF